MTSLDLLRLRLTGIVMLLSISFGHSAYGGACCLTTAGCFNTNEAMCATLGGSYLGDNVTCTTVSCDGACCHDSGGCTQAGEFECEWTGGTFQGHGTNCVSTQCLGACCLSGGQCVQISVQICELVGGSSQGFNTSCTTIDCGVGACCVSDTCYDATRHECDAMDGLHLGADSSCTTTQCQSAPIFAQLSPTSSTILLEPFDSQGGTLTIQNAVLRIDSYISLFAVLLNMSTSLYMDNTLVTYNGAISFDLPIGSDIDMPLQQVLQCSDEVLAPGDWCLVGPTSLPDPHLSVLTSATDPTVLCDLADGDAVAVGVTASGTPQHGSPIPHQLAVFNHVLLGTVQLAYIFSSCPADLNGDALVGIDDVLILFTNWGCSAECGLCEGDVDGDGTTGIDDLYAITYAWGACD